MAPAFSNQTEVLLFLDRNRWPKGPERRVSLLWPALAYRVVAPQPRSRSCNVLERAVLSLCRVGLRRAEEIAPRMHIERDLSAYILRDLQERGCLDSVGALTQAGEKLWEEELEDDAELRLCHVFQDVESGRLWPFLGAPALPFAERRVTDQGFPVLHLGSTGRLWEERPFVILPPPQALPDVPELTEILAVSQRHARRGRWREEAAPEDEESGAAADADDDEADEDTAAPGRAAAFDGKALERMSLMDEQGRPVLLLTFAYLPRRGAELQVCDPFTGRPSEQLCVQVQARARSLRSLDERLRRLQASGEENQREAAQQRQGDLQRQAERRVVERLGDEVYQSKLYEPALQMALAIGELNDLDEAPDYKRATPLGELRKALEVGVARIPGEESLARVYHAVYQGSIPHPDRGFVREVYEQAAQQVGFKLPLPPRLAEVHPEQLCMACKRRGGWRLRARLMATLLAATQRAEHVLHRAAQAEPLLLKELDQVYSQCSETVHGKPPERRALEETLETGWMILKLLIDLGV